MIRRLLKRHRCARGRCGVLGTTPSVGLYATALGRTATVVGKRSNVDDLGYFDTGTVAGTDGAFTTVTGTLDVGFHLAETEIVSHFGAILSCSLSSVGRVLLRTAETHLTGARPGDNLTFAVGERYDDVVEGAVNVQLALCVNLYVTLFCRDIFLCHSHLLFSCLLLVCNGLLATLASASVVLSALTTKRKTNTVTDATVAADIHEALDVQLYLRTEVTFDLEFCTDDFTDFGGLIVRPILLL